jgi:hypothetical protein
MVTGFVWGLCRSLRPVPQPDEFPGFETLDLLSGRLDNVEGAVAKLAAMPAGKEDLSDYATRGEMSEALAAVERRVESGVAERFGRQALAIGSLRAMIVDTDALLERVLERLEASSPETSMRASASYAAGDDPSDDRIMPLKEPARSDSARKEPVRT